MCSTRSEVLHMLIWSLQLDSDQSRHFDRQHSKIFACYPDRIVEWMYQTINQDKFVSDDQRGWDYYPHLLIINHCILIFDTQQKHLARKTTLPIYARSLESV